MTNADEFIVKFTAVAIDSMFAPSRQTGTPLPTSDRPNESSFDAAGIRNMKSSPAPKRRCSFIKWMGTLELRRYVTAR
jgi:hypothetical protein